MPQLVATTLSIRSQEVLEMSASESSIWVYLRHLCRVSMPTHSPQHVPNQGGEATPGPTHGAAFEILVHAASESRCCGQPWSSLAVAFLGMRHVDGSRTGPAGGIPARTCQGHQIDMSLWHHWIHAIY